MSWSSLMGWCSAARGKRRGRISTGGAGVEGLEDRRLLATFAVTSAADAGTGSLREAIALANAQAGSDLITFNLGQDRTIDLLTPLPALSDAAFIDGTTQPGYAGAPVVEIDGSALGGTADGMVIAASNSTVRGLAIGGFGGFGVSVLNATNIGVEANHVGGGSDGFTAGRGNGSGGVRLVNASNVSVNDNLISDNGGNGLSVTGTAAQNNLVAGNRIGTDLEGVGALGNGGNGILVSGAAGTRIGAAFELGPNWIAHNGAAGIRLDSATGTTVDFNRIEQNGGAGVAVVGAGSAGNRILSNGISDNGGLGIDVGAAGVTAAGAPVIRSVVINADGTATITGRVRGTPNTAFAIEFFRSAAGDPSGHGEGEVFLGQVSVTTDGAGVATGSFTTPGQFPAGAVATATATPGAAGGTTSEFSAAVAAGTAGAPLEGQGRTLPTVFENESLLGVVMGVVSDGRPGTRPEDYTVTVDWGDGSAAEPGRLGVLSAGRFLVRGSHTYAEPGSYQPTVTVTHEDGRETVFTASVFVRNGVGDLRGINVVAVEGIALRQVRVATFKPDEQVIAAGPGGVRPLGFTEFQAVVRWGDGRSSVGRVITAEDGSAVIRGSHRYAKGGNYRVTVELIGQSKGPIVVARSASRAKVLNAARIPLRVPFGARRGELIDRPVFAFIDANPLAVAGDYEAFINWGDGRTSTGVVQKASGGRFVVIGRHRYRAAGVFEVAVRVTDSLGDGVVFRQGVRVV